MATVEQLLQAWRTLDGQASQAEALVRRAYEEELAGGAGPTVEMIRSASRLRTEATVALKMLTDGTS